MQDDAAIVGQLAEDETIVFTGKSQVFDYGSGDWSTRRLLLSTKYLYSLAEVKVVVLAPVGQFTALTKHKTMDDIDDAQAQFVLHADETLDIRIKCL